MVRENTDSDKDYTEIVRDNADDEAILSDEFFPDRDRGILTSQDRRYLIGDSNLDGQDERNARYRIRNRTIHSLSDIQMICHHLSDRDLRQIANNDELNNPTAVNAAGLVSLAYQLLIHDDSVSNPALIFEKVAVESAIKDAESKMNPVQYDEVDVSVSIEIDWKDSDDSD